MDVHASLRHLRMSPRKVRLVVDAIRGKSVAEADTLLSFMKKDAAQPVQKLLRSAMANAMHNFQLSKDGLRVKTIMVDGGPVLKRSRPRAFGRAAPIRKRTSHITLVLSDGSMTSAKEKTAPKAEPKVEKPAAKKATRTAAPRKKASSNA